MIRNCYVEAEKFVWKNDLSSPRTGVIITGQPGIGMTISCISVGLRREIYRENSFHMVLTSPILKDETSYPTSCTWCKCAFLPSRCLPCLKGEGKAEEPLSVEVNYVLVRPAGEREHKWVLPEGWEQRRNVYLLELPLDDEVQKSDQKIRKRKASTSAITRSKRPPKETKASTSATTRPKWPPKEKKASTSASTGTRRSTRLKNVGEVEE
ncbi:hypothetical protein F5887DRAFT_581389 [Amanita rubescens]|nr:hypothetical protein F5887DRAFT_581389 [Amanita rubescens]